jgi:hypothetical protein
VLLRYRYSRSSATWSMRRAASRGAEHGQLLGCLPAGGDHEDSGQDMAALDPVGLELSDELEDDPGGIGGEGRRPQAGSGFRRICGE